MTKRRAEDDSYIEQPDRAPGEGSHKLSADPANRDRYLRCEEAREAYLKRLRSRNAASDEAFAQRTRDSDARQ